MCVWNFHNNQVKNFKTWEIILESQFRLSHAFYHWEVKPSNVQINKVLAIKMECSLSTCNPIDCAIIIPTNFLQQLFSLFFSYFCTFIGGFHSFGYSSHTQALYHARRHAIEATGIILGDFPSQPKVALSSSQWISTQRTNF